MIGDYLGRRVQGYTQNLTNLRNTPQISNLLAYYLASVDRIYASGYTNKLLINALILYDVSTITRVKHMNFQLLIAMLR